MTKRRSVGPWKCMFCGHKITTRVTGCQNASCDAYRAKAPKERVIVDTKKQARPQFQDARLAQCGGCGQVIERERYVECYPGSDVVECPLCHAALDRFTLIPVDQKP